MTMLGSICNRAVVVVNPKASVAQAARLMRDNHVGTLVVTETDGADARPAGIVTDRDLVVEIMALDLDADDVTVAEIMTPAPVLAREDEDVREALGRMRAECVRRLPVVSESGRLVGIVAADDLLKVLAGDITALAGISARERSREAERRKALS